MWSMDFYSTGYNLTQDLADEASTSGAIPNHLSVTVAFSKQCTMHFCVSVCLSVCLSVCPSECGVFMVKGNNKHPIFKVMKRRGEKFRDLPSRRVMEEL